MFRVLAKMWIHDDSMYVRLGGMRNTKTWSKSSRSSIKLFEKLKMMCCG